MKTTMKTKFVLAIAFAAAISAQTPAGDSQNGKRVFEKDGCFQCHGYAAQGSRDGPTLAATKLTQQVMMRYVRKPFGSMPAYTAKVLSDRDLADIYAYLKSFPAAKPAKDIPLLDQMRDK